MVEFIESIRIKSASFTQIKKKEEELSGLPPETNIVNEKLQSVAKLYIEPSKQSTVKMVKSRIIFNFFFSC